MLMIVKQSEGKSDVADVEVHVGYRLSASPELVNAALGELKKQRKTLIPSSVSDHGQISHGDLTITWTLREFEGAPFDARREPHYLLSLELI